jgi:hypothetical protein
VSVQTDQPICRFVYFVYQTREDVILGLILDGLPQSLAEVL